MKLCDAKACVLRVGGTNCDAEIKWVLEDLGLSTDILHMNQAIKKDLADYQMLVFPGGFSYGDYVRAGAIWSREILTKLKKDLEIFIDEGKLVLGICNGFQVLVEIGILPGDGENVSGIPTAVLANNISAKYECRWVNLKVESDRIPFFGLLKKGQALQIPIGHGEGRFILQSEDALTELIKNNQVVLRYISPDCAAAEGKYPNNPNGAVYDIAGICNRKGNVMGMMPHPERAYFGWQLPSWGKELPKFGDGKAIFESAVNYIKKY
ncbi:MAG: phosphoribosylformylglycinamidine synthase I [Candidatus Methanomethylicus sp.]|nr:phosphoribosylformylglycinamidine synthase I [Candidatus Methanomethylicus sp.]